MYVVRYVLLVINRNTLLNSIVAIAADWLGVLASVAAIAAVIASGVMLIRWLIARRAAVFAHSRPAGVAFRPGVVGRLPGAAGQSAVGAGVRHRAGNRRRALRPAAQTDRASGGSLGSSATLVSIFAIVTSFATDAQGIANNTVLMVFAYLFAAATVAAVARVFEGFERKPVERPAHRWVVVDPDRPTAGAPASAAPVELEGQEPAA